MHVPSKVPQHFLLLRLKIQPSPSILKVLLKNYEKGEKHVRLRHPKPPKFLISLLCRLDKLEEVYKRRENDYENMIEEMATLRTDYEKRKFIVPELAERFQFYQDLRGYVTDLVECLDEKVGYVKSVCVRHSRHFFFTVLKQRCCIFHPPLFDSLADTNYRLIGTEIDSYVSKKIR